MTAEKPSLEELKKTGDVREEFRDALELMIAFVKGTEGPDFAEQMDAIEPYLSPKERALLELVALHLYR
jgi:hypothetical protein